MIDSIRHVHLELSSRCNAACPLCPRNFYGYEFNDGYPECDLSLPQIKKAFTPKIMSQLTTVFINGNFGDMILNPESADIVEFFRQHNARLDIDIQTTGSARSADFWRQLAKARARVTFAIDGLEDTHKLYRQNTSWKKIIDNAKTFIAAGGYATWKFLVFDHNRHQIEECRSLAKTLGFQNFISKNNERQSSPVFNRDGVLTHVIDNYTGVTDLNQLLSDRQNNTLSIADVKVADYRPSVNCWAKRMKSLYINAAGEVYPCCWLGFYPSTYGHGTYLQVANSQISKLMSRNNINEYSLDECVEWFSEVEKSWGTKNCLIMCDDVCGGP